MSGFVRAGVRELVYRLAIVSGWCLRQRKRNRAPVLCFHNVVVDGSPRGESPLHVPAEDFEVYMRWLSSAFEVVPLREIASRVAEGDSVQGLAAVTFDDAYMGVFRNAVPIMRALGVPSTVFVVTEASSDPTPFWWDVLATEGSLSGEVRRRCLEELRGDRKACLGLFGADGGRTLEADLLPASWDEISRATDSVDLGSHTVSHRNLAALDPDELRDELVRSWEVLVERFSGAVKLISYPYGLVNASVFEEARRAGYIGGVSLRTGTLAPEQDPYDLSRIHVPAGISKAGLEARVADIERLKR